MDGVDGDHVLLILLPTCTAGKIPEGVDPDQAMRDKCSRLRWLHGLTTLLRLVASLYSRNRVG